MGYYRSGATSFARGRPLYALGYKSGRTRRPYRGGYKKPPSGAPLRQGMRVRIKMRARGATAAYTRRRRRINKVTSHGDNASSSYTSMKARWNSKLRALYRIVLGRQTRMTQSSGTGLSGTGTQNSTNTLYFTRSQLESMTTAAAGGTSTANAVKLFIGNITYKTYFKNQSNAIGKLMIYDLMCKRQSPSLSMDTPREAWTKGLEDAGGTAAAMSTIGCNPSASAEFRLYWDIKRVTTVDLEAGQQHTHIVSRSINKVFDSTYWANSVGDSVPYLTGAVLFVWHGSLAHESATPATVTFTDMRLDFATNFTFNFGYVNQNQPSYAVTTAFPTSLVDPDFMGESGDTDANVVNA